MAPTSIGGEKLELSTCVRPAKASPAVDGWLPLSGGGFFLLEPGVGYISHLQFAWVAEVLQMYALERKMGPHSPTAR